MTPGRSASVPVILPLLACILFVMGGCGKPELDSIDIDPTSATVTVGQTKQFSATPRDTKGEAMEDKSIAWSVQGESGQIDAEGLFTAVKPGPATVAATVEGIRQTASITVAQEPVAALEATPDPPTVAAGEPATVTVVVKNAQGGGIADVSVQAEAISADATLDKTSANTDASGQVTFTITTAPQVQNNQVKIRAGGQEMTAAVQSHAGPPATANVSMGAAEVTAREQTPIEVAVVDKANNPVPDVAVQFAGGEGAKVTPAEATTDAQGRVNAVVRASPSAGVNPIQVSVAGLPAQTVQLQSLPGAAAQVTLQADTAATIAGGTVNLSATVQDAHGNGVPNATVQLTVSPADATLQASALTSDASGTAATVLQLSPTPGANTVEAVAGDAPPSQITITGQPPTELRVTPQTATIEMLGSQPFRATGIDAEGHRVDLTPEWQVVGKNGTIDAAGNFTAQGLGDATVLATYGELTSGAQITIVPGAVATVDVTPVEKTVTAGTNFQFAAQALNAHGHPLEVTPTWEVSNDVGTVDAVGLFTATTAGEGEVIATAADQTGRANITVTPGPLITVEVEPQEVRLRAGEETQLQAKGYDAGGNEVTLEPIWSLAADLGELSAAGVFRALHAGTGEIKVEAGPLPIVIAIPVEVVAADLHRVELTPKTLTASAGEQHTFTAAGYDAYDNTVDIEAVWSLSADHVGQIDERGSFYARKTGSVQVLATVGEITAEASVTVKPSALARLTVQPSGPLTLTAGTTVSFTLNGYDAFDNTVALSPTWEQTPPLGTLDPDGSFRAEKVGSGELIAQQGDLRVAVPVTVETGKLSRIGITPTTATLQAGDRLKWSAQGFDAYDNEVSISPAWRVAESVGEITEAGEFTATQAKTGQIIATAEGVSGRVDVTVEPGALTMLSVTPEQLNLTAGDTAKIIVVGYDAYGNPAPLQPTWHIPEGMGAISAEHVFTAQKAGTGRIIIAAADLAEIIDLSVETGDVTTVEVVPATAQVVSGSQQTFSVQGLDRGGNPVPVDATWEVQGDGGSMSADGVFTATQVGASRVRVRVGELTGEAAVEVLPGPAASLQMMADAASVTAGETVKLQSEARDAAGNIVPTAPAWKVEGGIGTVSEDGVFTAQKAGTGAIVATVGEVSQSTALEVQPGPLASVSVAPQISVLRAGEKQQFTATGFDAYGNARPVEATWSVSGGIGQIDATGAFEATTQGAGAVIAVVGPLAGMARFRVEPGKVAQLHITPARTTVAAGADVAFTVTMLDAYNNVTTAALQWQMSAQLGHLTDGVFRAENAGATEITVRSAEVEARAAIEVQCGKIVRLDILPKALDLAAGEQAQVQATGFDAFDNARGVSVTWELIGAVGALTDTGKFTGGKQGTGQIAARLDDLSASIPVTVVPGAVQRLEVRPAHAQVAATTSQQFTVIGFDGVGNDVPVQANWALSKDIGILTQTGQFTGTYVGKGTVVAYTPQALVTAALSVQPGPVALVFVTPQPASAAAGENVTFQAQGFDAHHNTIPSLQPHWQVAGNIGTIEAETGVFTATLVGKGKVKVDVGGMAGSADVSIHPGTADAQQSRLVASRLRVPADGRTSADIIIHVQDRYGNPIADANVLLISSREDQIDQPVPTNQHGVALGHVRSMTPGESEIIAVVESVRISNPIRLTFKAEGASG